MRLRYAATAAFFLGLGFISQAVIAATTLPQGATALSLLPKNVSTCIAGFTPSPINFDAKVVTSYTCRSAVLACAKGTIGRNVRSSQSTITYKCTVPDASTPTSSTSTSDDWNVSPQ
jgi:hypothetical protein